MVRTPKLPLARASVRRRRAGSGLAIAIFVLCVEAGCSGSSTDTGIGVGGSGTIVGGGPGVAGASGTAGGVTGGAANAMGGASGASSTAFAGSTGAFAGSSGAFAVSSLFSPNGGPSACPSLAQSSCWQRLLQEYVTVASCFTHRSSCDASGDSGDATECGVWTDASHLTCNWPDGTQVDHDVPSDTDVIKSPTGTECYRKQFMTVNGMSTIVVTFGTRAYTVSLDPVAQTATFVCPDDSRVTANETEFQACNLRGICCSFPSPVCAGSDSL
jgi:hypothetical protein